MKVLSILSLALLSISGVTAVPAPDTTSAADADAKAVCDLPGHPCDKLRRATALTPNNDLAKRVAPPSPWLPIGNWYFAFAGHGMQRVGMQQNRWCYFVGQACGGEKARRAMDEIKSIAGERPAPVENSEAVDACNAPGGHCYRANVALGLLLNEVKLAEEELNGKGGQQPGGQ